MLQASFCPCALSSMPPTSSGVVSNLSGIGRPKDSSRAAWIAACCGAGSSKALRSKAGSASDAASSAAPSVASAGPSTACRRWMKTSHTRCSRLTPARSPSTRRVMSNTCCCVSRAISACRCCASVSSAFARWALAASAASRASSCRRSRSACAASLACRSSSARCSSKAWFFCVELVLLLVSLGLGRGGVRQFRCNLLLPCAMASSTGWYRKRFISHTRMMKFSSCAPTVNQSMSTVYFPAAWAAAAAAFQNGLAKIRIIDTTKQ